jgi:GNAT superfamily N-acetyltransferase
MLAEPSLRTERARARVRELGPEDAAEAAALASAAFSRNRFYQRALGFHAPAFDVYWREFLPLAMRDPGARVFGLEVSGRPEGLLVIGTQGFPSPRRAIPFLGRILVGVGPARFARFLYFLRTYERVMKLCGEDRRREARGLWLLVSPRAGGGGRGSFLVRSVMERMAAEGKPAITGLLDAGNLKLCSFYRRMGFVLGPPFPFFGGTASTLVLRMPDPEDKQPC